MCWLGLGGSRTDCSKSGYYYSYSLICTVETLYIILLMAQCFVAPAQPKFNCLLACRRSGTDFLKSGYYYSYSLICTVETLYIILLMVHRLKSKKAPAEPKCGHKTTQQTVAGQSNENTKKNDKPSQNTQEEEVNVC